MSQIKVTCVPIISIKGINPAAIFEGIIKGQYSAKPEFLNQTSTSEMVTLTSCATSNVNQSNKCMHTYLDGASNMKTVTTGTDTFDSKIRSGICLFCKTHRKLPFGYCFRSETSRYGCVEYFVEPGRMCRPECTLARINEINLTDEERDNCTKLTQEMLCALLGVNEPFIPADDFMVLTDHGGTETYETWVGGKTKYTILPDVVIVPTKREYSVVSRV